MVDQWAVRDETRPESALRGPIGPEGPEGGTGSRGPRGPGIIYGAAPPNDTDGSDGDTWIVLGTGTTSAVWGPKVGGHWPSQPSSKFGVSSIDDVPGAGAAAKLGVATPGQAQQAESDDVALTPAKGKVALDFQIASAKPPTDAQGGDAVSSFAILKDWREAVCKGIGLSAARTATQNAASLRQFLLDRTNAGGTVVIDDRYDVDPIRVDGLNSDICLDFKPSTRLRGAGGFSTPVLSFNGLANRPTARTIRLISPAIDCSLGDNTGANSQPSAIDIFRFDHFHIENPRLYGGDTWAASKADTGIQTTECGSGLISGGFIRGFNDAGWYPGGGNGDVSETAEYGLSQRMIGTLIANCQAGISAKRAARHVEALGVTFRKCQVGASAVFVPLPQQPFPAKRMDLIACMFEMIGARAFDYHGGSRGSVVGSTITDFGFAEDEVTAVPGAVAGLLFGAKNVDIKSNTFELRRWARSDQRGVVQVNVTENGVAYVAGGNTFSGNTYRKLVSAAVEGSGTTPNTYHGEMLDDVSAALPFGLNGQASVTYTKVGDRTHYTQVGATTYKAPLQEFFFAAKGTLLSGLGSLAAGTIGPTQTISVPGALNGDIVVLTPNNAATLRADVTYACRANTDQVNISVRNGSGAAIDFASLSFSLHVYRPA